MRLFRTSSYTMAYAPSPAASTPAASFKSPPPTSSAPQGTFLPGTKVQVGSQRVTIEKYLSEGGFAHVYVVRVPRENHKHELAVLKRVAVPDREQLATMRTEVETMKKLQGHKHVVKYMDSHASQLKGGGYEVFLLMEYCGGGGLIDFMNTRLQHRLTEPEILKIFGDVAEGVACMHYLKPPLLHRDLKVENVLISKSSTTGTPTYKVCDFGSAAPPRPAAKTTEEAHLIEEDVQKNTTMQYRSPEMIDVWRKQPIDEKADIWALGVLLYKLCYYTTPFENVGQMAILNASYKYPSHPPFSDKLKNLIGSMLKEDPKKRPNIYEVIRDVCKMRGTEVPIKDIYAQRTHSEARRNESLPVADPPMKLGLSKQAPAAEVQSIPDIAPMRRGRPGAPTQPAPTPAVKPNPSPARGDPFAALDSKEYDIRKGAVDELSQKYPSLDEFSIAHEKGGTFTFPPRSDSKPADATPQNKSSNVNERVANALADQVFGQSRPSTSVPRISSATQLQQVSSSPSKLGDVHTSAREIMKDSRSAARPPAPAIAVEYTTTGTGASPPASATKTQFPEISSRPIWKVPDQSRASSQLRNSGISDGKPSSLVPPKHSEMVEIPQYKSKTGNLTSTSSRPSLEGHRPVLAEDAGEPLTRTKSATFRQRPSSAYVSSNLDYLRDQEHTRKRPSTERRRSSKDPSRNHETAIDDANIIDDMDYLRHNEDAERRMSHRHSLHRKNGSRSSHSVSSGAKHILGGKLGDAFKRFEHRPSDDEILVDMSSEKPILQLAHPGHRDPKSDADSAIDETEDLPPEMRREMERRRLSQEERRVAKATAEYRSQVEESQGTGGVGGLLNRASTIQKRVQTLLDEAGQSSAPTKRTAEGYGRYTDTSDEDAPEPRRAATTVIPTKTAPPPTVASKPMVMSASPSLPYARPKQQPLESTATAPAATASSAQATAPRTRELARPSVPPKSPSLRTGGAPWPPLSTAAQISSSLKPSSGLAALLAKDLEGVPDYPPRGSSAACSTAAETSANGSAGELGDDLESDFSRRYPSLSGIEMVETEIGGQRKVLRAREV